MATARISLISLFNNNGGFGVIHYSRTKKNVGYELDEIHIYSPFAFWLQCKSLFHCFDMMELEDTLLALPIEFYLACGKPVLGYQSEPLLFPLYRLMTSRYSRDYAFTPNTERIGLELFMLLLLFSYLFTGQFSPIQVI